MDRQPGDIVVIDVNRPVTGMLDADYHIKCRRLACPIRSQKADNLPLVYMNADSVDDIAFFIRFD